LAKVYTLEELARGIDLAGHRRAKARLREVIEGRNCSLFESLRVWAYKAVPEYWRPEGRGLWEAAVLAEAKAMAAGYLLADPSFARDVRMTSRSVARWVWGHFTPQKRADLIERTHGAERQRERSNKRWAAESQRAAGVEMLKAGMSDTEVAREMLVSDRTVRRWRVYV
jgi:DNA-binding transcriptional regulator YiaG